MSVLGSSCVAGNIFLKDICEGGTKQTVLGKLICAAVRCMGGSYLVLDGMFKDMHFVIILSKLWCDAGEEFVNVGR